MDKYQKVRVLGKGNFGSAILIKRKSDGALFVVKEVSLQKMSKKERDEARHECTVLQQLKHPNIVRYVEQFENRNNLYIVMEYCDGGDIAGKVKQSRGPLKESTIMYYFSQVCLAMEYLHTRHILHRDIKTMNVFLMKNGAVKVGDFGISTVLQNTMGMANTVCGTPYYFSPELCRNKPYNNKSDVWALGVLLYECATAGRHPFDGNNMNQLMQRIVKGTYAPLPSLYSNEFRKMVDWCLQKDPSKRPSIKQALALPIVRRSLEQLEENLMLATQCRVRLKDIIDFEAGIEGSNAQEKKDHAVANRAYAAPPGMSPGQAAALAMAGQHAHNPSHGLQIPAPSPKSPARALNAPGGAVVGPKPAANPLPPSNQVPLGNRPSPYLQYMGNNQMQLAKQWNPSPLPVMEKRPLVEPSPGISPTPNDPYRRPSNARNAANVAPDRRQSNVVENYSANVNRMNAIIAKYGHNADAKAKETIHAYMKRKQEEYQRRQKEELEARERRQGMLQREMKAVLEQQRNNVQNRLNSDLPLNCGQAHPSPSLVYTPPTPGADRHAHDLPSNRAAPKRVPSARGPVSRLAASPSSVEKNVRRDQANSNAADRKVALAANSPRLLAENPDYGYPNSRPTPSVGGSRPSKVGARPSQPPPSSDITGQRLEFDMQPTSDKPQAKKRSHPVPVEVPVVVVQPMKVRSPQNLQQQRVQAAREQAERTKDLLLRKKKLQGKQVGRAETPRTAPKSKAPSRRVPNVARSPPVLSVDGGKPGSSGDSAHVATTPLRKASAQLQACQPTAPRQSCVDGGFIPAAPSPRRLEALPVSTAPSSQVPRGFASSPSSPRTGRRELPGSAAGLIGRQPPLPLDVPAVMEEYNGAAHPLHRPSPRWADDRCLHRGSAQSPAQLAQLEPLAAIPSDGAMLPLDMLKGNFHADVNKNLIPTKARPGPLPSISGSKDPHGGNDHGDAVAIHGPELVDIPYAAHIAEPTTEGINRRGSYPSDIKPMVAPSSADGVAGSGRESPVGVVMDSSTPLRIDRAGERYVTKDIQPVHLPVKTGGKSNRYRPALGTANLPLYPGLVQESHAGGEMYLQQLQKREGLDDPVTLSMLETLRGLRSSAEAPIRSDGAEPDVVSASGQLTLLKQRHQQLQQNISLAEARKRSSFKEPKDVDRFWHPSPENGRAGTAGRSRQLSMASAPVTALSLGDLNHLHRPAPSGATPSLGVETTTVACVSPRTSVVDGYVEMLTHLKDLLYKRKGTNGHAVRRLSEEKDTPHALGASKSEMDGSRSPPPLMQTREQVCNAISDTDICYHGGGEKDGAREDGAIDEGAPNVESDEEDDDFEDAVPLSPVRCAEFNDTYARGMHAIEDSDCATEVREGEVEELTHDVFLSGRDEEEEGEDGYTGYYGDAVVQAVKEIAK